MPLAFVGSSRESYAGALERLEAGVPNLSADELTRVAGDLFAVAGVMHNEGALRRALADPAVPRDAKTGLLDSLLGDKLSQASLDVLRGVVTSRWSQPRDLVDAADTLGVIALLAAAETDGQLDEVEDELFRFGRLLDREPALQVALGDPSAPADRRLGLVTDLLRERVRPATLRLVEEAVAAPRGRSLDRALDDYVRLAADRRSRLVAEVWTATPLSAEQTERLAAGLSRIYGRDMSVQTTVEPSIAGGLVVRVGDEVIDGSIATRLQTVRRQIAG